MWFILRNIVKEYSTKRASHWGHKINKIPAARHSFSSGAGRWGECGWRGDRHSQENEVCVRSEVPTGEMGALRKAASPADFQRSHGRHVTKRWDKSFLWPRGTVTARWLEGRVVLGDPQKNKMKHASCFLD